MTEYLLNPETWAALFTLTVLEVVLGIDNLVFLAIVSSRLPPHQQPSARKIGLFMALFLRVGLLTSLTWIAGLTEPVFTIGTFAVSWRDIVLGVGGLYLIYKGVDEIHEAVEGGSDSSARGYASYGAVIAQIMVLDLVFSLDSIITAVGMTNNLPVMIAAIMIAVFTMMFAANSVSGFIARHPTIKMLALAFLILVGTALVADAAHFHIPREYLYFAIAFSIAVEALNMLVRRSETRRASPPADRP
ncbi:MAG: TerC family protein [Alphaproteobacteria bacterium]|nr:TerC family protein [Alphaproteobacteria bacterium]